MWLCRWVRRCWGTCRNCRQSLVRCDGGETGCASVHTAAADDHGSLLRETGMERRPCHRHNEVTTSGGSGGGNGGGGGGSGYDCGGSASCAATETGGRQGRPPRAWPRAQQAVTWAWGTGGGPVGRCRLHARSTPPRLAQSGASVSMSARVQSERSCASSRSSTAQKEWRERS